MERQKDGLRNARARSCGKSSSPEVPIAATLYEKSPARWRLPMSVQRVFTPSTPGWLLIELAILAILIGLALKRQRPDRMWLLPPTLLVGAYPQLLVLGDVDGLEPDRHALGAMVEIRIAMIIALVLALTVLVPAWLTSARVQARVYPAPPPFRLKHIPFARRPTRTRS